MYFHMPTEQDVTNAEKVPAWSPNECISRTLSISRIKHAS